MYTMNLFLLVLLLSGVQYSEQKDSLKITVYYETLCPDSLNFILYQLIPMMGEFNRYPDWLTVDLIPYGKAKETSHYQFTCQHGPTECEANKMNACAIDQLVTKEQPNPLYLRLANFMYCTMNTPDQIKSARKCAVQTGVNYQALKSCYTSDKGSQLLEMYGNRTAALQPPLSWVPTVVFNDVYNQTLNDQAQTGLYKLVCYFVPDQCQ